MKLIGMTVGGGSHIGQLHVKRNREERGKRFLLRQFGTELQNREISLLRFNSHSFSRGSEPRYFNWL